MICNREGSIIWVRGPQSSLRFETGGFDGSAVPPEPPWRNYVYSTGRESCGRVRFGLHVEGASGGHNKHWPFLVELCKDLPGENW